MRMALTCLAMLALAGCVGNEVEVIGQAAAEKRRQMNDLQARGTMAATCDLSIGSYWRELTPVERALADQICNPNQIPANWRVAP